VTKPKENLGDQKHVLYKFGLLLIGMLVKKI